MSQTPPDDLDLLLASLINAAPLAEPASAQVAISAKRAVSLERLRAWLAERLPNAYRDPNWLPEPDPGYEVAVTEPVKPVDPEIAAELAVGRAWRDGDRTAFDAALAQLPPDRAEHQRRMILICDRIKARWSERVIAPTPGGRS